MTTKNKSIDLVVLDKELSEKGKHTLKTTYEKEVTTELNSFLYELDKYQKAKKRKGLASVKNRSAVNGGGAKPYKQKGTGNARRGTNTTPLRRGGGVIFGPEPRSFAYKLDSNVKKYGYQELLKLKSANTYVVEESTLSSVKKTKEARNKLEKLKVGHKDKLVIIVEDDNSEIIKPWSNLRNVNILNRRHLSVNEVIHSNFILVQNESLKKLEENYFG